LLTRLLRRGGPLLALALVCAAAAASLFGTETARRIAGSPVFIAIAALITVASLASSVMSLTGRRWTAALLHGGLAVALAGVAVNQRLCRPGFLFLEMAGPAKNCYISSDLSRLELLPASVRLDSLAMHTARGFRPAPVAHTTAEPGPSVGVTWNRPLELPGRRLMLSRLTEPGFLDEYELALDSAEFLLLHNQIAVPASGVALASFAFDAEQARVGLRLNQTEAWLGIGETATIAGHRLSLRSASFARSMGVIYAVNDTRFRLIIFAGFALSLLGLLGPLLRRKEA
jgi:hypothetical protein